MPIGLSLKANLPRKGFLGRVGPEELFAKISADIGEHARWWQTTTKSGRPCLVLNFFPGNEGVHFTIDGHFVVAEADTSYSGPGYHQHVIDLLDKACAECETKWHEHGQGDTSGYWQSRDRGQLERVFTAWLEAQAQSVIDDPDKNAAALSGDSSVHYEVATGKFVTPCGPRDLDWVRGAAVAGWKHTDFWPWWPAGNGPDKRLGEATQLLWHRVPWRVSTTDPELTLYRDIHSMLMDAKLSGQPGVPWHAWHDLATWLPGISPGLSSEIASNAKADPSPTVGFLRGPATYQLGLGWSITLPGVWVRDDSELVEDHFNGPIGEIIMRVYSNIPDSFVERAMRTHDIHEVNIEDSTGFLLTSDKTPFHPIFVANEDRTGIVASLELFDETATKQLATLFQHLRHRTPVRHTAATR